MPETYLTLEKLLLPVRGNDLVAYASRRTGREMVLLVGMAIRR